MSTTSTTTTWEQLPGQTVQAAGKDGKKFWLDLDGGRISFGARGGEMGLHAERVVDADTTADVADWAVYAGKTIASINVTVMAADHGERSRALITFADGEQLALRSEISVVPVVIG